MAHVVTVHHRQINGLFLVGGQAFRWNHGQARKVAATAEVTAPRATGDLAFSHEVRQHQGITTGGGHGFQSGFRVSNVASYAEYVARGTGLYGPRGAVIDIGKRMGPIFDPKPGGGRSPVYIRTSRGQKPNDWLERAARTALKLG